MTAFGNMTFGGGLSAALSNTGNAYAQDVTGWIGKDVDTSRQLQAVRVTSQTNGFDASGSTSEITIQVRGSNTLPTSAMSGVVIGSLPTFTDVNALTTKTVWVTALSTYAYVWVNVFTGVWSAVTNVEYVYTTPAPAPAPAPAPTPTPTVTSSDSATIFKKVAANTVVKKACDAGLVMPQGAAVISPFTYRFEILRPTVCVLNFQANFVHRGEKLIPQYLGVVGVGVSVEYRKSATEASVSSAPLKRFDNASSGINIYDRNPAHYGAVAISTAELLTAGFYELVVYGSAHTDADSRDGIAAFLVEGGRGLNGLVLTFLPDVEYQS